MFLLYLDEKQINYLNKRGVVMFHWCNRLYKVVHKKIEDVYFIYIENNNTLKWDFCCVVADPILYERGN